ncbi:uncharacterized protein [Apostichopus japonicus]|uniref:uncharacterized protein n=1 Tax=Stichopus japonicus TaxID=307972 RepID=UPI003AB8E5C4
MDGMRDNLQCPIHLDLLENAKTLPCQHVVCEECIGLWVAKKGELICPTCKTGHSLPAGGVQNLPTNFMVNSLVEEFKNVGKGGKKRDGRKKSDSESPRGGKQMPSNQTMRADFKKTFIEKTSKIYEDICGSNISLIIHLCNSRGGPVSCKDSDKVSVNILTPKGKKIGSIMQRKENSILVSFVPKMCGVHRVESLLGKYPIKGSPLMVVVHPDGKFLAGVRGPFKSPRDVTLIGSTLCVTDFREGPYVCTDWLGRKTGEVHSPQTKGGKDSNPFGIVAIDGRLYVTDIANNCVNIYFNGNFLSSFGKNYMSQPVGIATDQNKFIYVSNQGSNEVLVFGPNLALSKSINCDAGKKSSNDSILSCLAINQAEDKLVVADQGNHCLKIISIEQSKVVHTITTRVSQAQATPCGVAIDQDDNVYATVVYKPSEQKGTKDVAAARQRGRGAHGVHPKDYGGWGDGARQVRSLIEGDDTEKGAVLMYNSEGYFLGRFGDSELLNPGGICVHDEPFLTAFVVDMEGSGHGSKGPAVKVFTI